MNNTTRGGFRSARSMRPATISNAGARPSTIAPPHGKHPTKQQLRDELAEAARNTANDAHATYSARNYPL